MKIVGKRVRIGKARMLREGRHRIALTVGDRHNGPVVSSFAGTCVYLVYVYEYMQRR